MIHRPFFVLSAVATIALCGTAKAEEPKEIKTEKNKEEWADFYDGRSFKSAEQIFYIPQVASQYGINGDHFMSVIPCECAEKTVQHFLHIIVRPLVFQNESVEKNIFLRLTKESQIKKNWEDTKIFSLLLRWLAN